MEVWGLFRISVDGDTCLTEELVALYTLYSTAIYKIRANNDLLMPYPSRAELWEANRTSYEPSEKVDMFERYGNTKCYIIEKLEVQE
jgi:hypothetical protein